MTKKNFFILENMLTMVKNFMSTTLLQSLNLTDQMAGLTKLNMTLNKTMTY